MAKTSGKSKNIIIISLVIVLLLLLIVLSPFLGSITSYFIHEKEPDDYDLLHNDPVRDSLPESYKYNNITFTKTFIKTENTE